MTTQSKEAMNAAKALYPSGVGSYSYSEPELNQRAMDRDWSRIAHLIDAEFAGMRKENEKMKDALTRIAHMKEYYADGHQQNDLIDAQFLAESALAQASEKKM